MIDLFSEYGLSLSEEQRDQLESYYHRLIEWNQKINLTTITSYDDVVRKHFLDSAMLLSLGQDSSPELSKILSSERSLRVIDVGTGAGFPGLVLAILRPDWEIVLLDSLNKRIDFLNVVISELSLKNVRAVHGRAEEFGRDEDFRCGFDLVVSRAVADLRLLLEFCIPFVSDDGIFVSYKGPKVEEELTCSSHAFEELKADIAFEHKLSLGDSERTLVGFSRVGDLPDKYPRRPGIPAKRPL